jgi:hypothetical protein
MGALRDMHKMHIDWFGAVAFAAVLAAPAHSAPVKNNACHMNDIKASGPRLQLNIAAPEGSLGEQATYVLSGAPSQISIAQAVKINDVWALSGAAVSKAEILAPSNFRGKFVLRLQCVIAGQIYDSSANVEISNHASSQAELEGSPLMKQAESLLDNGDIVRARLLLTHLTGKGSARAAYLLSQTYDAQYLKQRNVQGVVPDATLAAQWLRDARELGWDEPKPVASGKTRR